MDDVKRHLVAGTACAVLFCLSGCAQTSWRVPSPIVNPAATVSSPDIDPWAAMLVAPEEIAPPMPLPKIPLPVPEPDVTVQTEESPSGEERVDLAALEELLSKDLWIKNVELPLWIENGMKDPHPKRDREQLQRRANFDRLNMSAEEQRKRGKTNTDYSSGLISTWRWVHRDLERLTGMPTTRRADPEDFFQDEKYRTEKHAVLRANAAILMGRDGDPLAANFLLQSISNEKLRVELRCAAAETAGKLDTLPAGELISLIDGVKDRDVETVDPKTKTAEVKFQNGNVALWTELLEAIAQRIEPCEHPCFLDALDARSGNMRLETAKIWRHHPPRSRDDRLPERYLDFARRELDPAIRMEIVRTLGIWKEPTLLELVRNDLRREAGLRNAAIQALASAGCKEALPLIKERLRDQEGKNRAKAVAALRTLGCLDDVFRMADDKDRDVRTEVAKAMSESPTPQTRELAEKYLADHEKVQEAVLDSIAVWPIDLAGPLFFQALKSASPKIRGRAVELLGEHLPEAKDYDAAAAPSNQTACYTELLRSFQERYPESSVGIAKPERKKPDVPDELLLADLRRCLDDWNRPGQSRDDREALAERLTDLDDRLLPLLEYLYDTERRPIPESLDPLIARTDPLFAWIVRLDSEETATRQSSASELARLGRNRELGTLATRRILDRSLREPEPSVQGPLLETLESSDGGSARRLALRLLDSDSADLRRRSCDVLKDHGTAGDVDLLTEILHDPNRAVVRSAMEAVGSILVGKGNETASEKRSEVVTALMPMLALNDPYLQVDAAATLHVLGEPVGRETLNRLSFSPNSRVKLYVAGTLAALEDPVFMPVLIRFLDENGSVCQSALSALPKLAGEDIGLVETKETCSYDLSPTRKKVLRWKAWAENRPFE